MRHAHITSHVMNPWSLAVALLLPLALAGGSLAKPPVERAAAAQAVRDSLVRVEYTLRYDKSEPPRGGGWNYACPTCGEHHSLDLEDFIKEERPATHGGMALSPTRILTVDPLIHPRFIESIAVRFGQQVVPAKPAAYGADQNALMLDLAQPLQGVKPLAFTPLANGPYLAIGYEEEGGTWNIGIQSLSTNIGVRENGERFIPIAPGSLIVDESGTPVAAWMNSELPADDSWKAPPAQWKMVSAADMEKLLGNLQEAADRTVLRVALSFRSPAKTQELAMRRRFQRGPQDDQSTERNVAGVLIDDTHIVVLEALKPKVTARLERIRVYADQPEPIAARFVASLADYGCFIAELEQHITTPAGLAGQDVMAYRNKLMPAAEITMHGESRIAYYGHTRIAAYRTGWKGHVYPASETGAASEFVFDAQGRLVALPVAQRVKVSLEEQWSGERPALTVASYLAAAVNAGLQPGSASVDPNNIPLTEEQENRLAWMGVELQPLNESLARANNISDETNDGQTGAIITHVYEGSPAATAGVQPGDILLRLHVPGHPKPIDVDADEDQFGFGAGGFPWDRLDEVPEQYYDQIPQPWPSAESGLNRKLTDIGFGTSYSAEVFRDGQRMMVPLHIVLSPAHYNSAPRAKSDALGLTVRDLTYEAQRYFQRTAQEPGVIVSKIEPGSRASIAGLKPYEVITHVNDHPILSVGDFEKFIAGEHDLRLAVRRMTRGRIVKIDMGAAPSAPQAPPGAAQPGAEPEQPEEE